MSYTLLEHREVKAAKKAHRCIWCGEAINVGEPYLYERSIFDGNPQSHHWHGECSEDSVTHFANDGPEFIPYENERPTARTHP